MSDNDLVGYIRQLAAEQRRRDQSILGRIGRFVDWVLRRQRPINTVAVWIPATKRALSDAEQLRAIIDGEMSGQN